MTGGSADHWLPTMTQAFIALDSSTHAISTAEFAMAMEKVWIAAARVHVDARGRGVYCLPHCSILFTNL